MNQKASKQIFERVQQLLNEAHEQYLEMDCVKPETVDEYNDLIEKFDFKNEVFTDEDGLKGVKWCWGGVMVPAIYDEIKFFTTFVTDISSYFVIATKDGKDYLLNYTGLEVFCADELLPDTASITPARFRRNNKWGIVNSAGQIILDNKYDVISSNDNDFIFLTLNGKEGFIDPFGNIVQPIFDRIEVDADDYLLVTLNGEKGYIDENRNFTTNKTEAFYSMNLVFSFD